MKTALLLACAPLLCLITAPLQAQFADDCANATVLTGTGQFNWSNLNATTDGAPDPLCDFFGLDQIIDDIWYSWTAPASGTFVFDMCGNQANTKIAVYQNSCTGPILYCNDNFCGTQSRITFDALAGNTFILRIGVAPGWAQGFGTFKLEQLLPMLNPANGHYYQYVAGFMPWPQARTAAENMSYLGLSGHLVTIENAQEDDFVYNTLTGAALGNAWLGAFQDVNSPNYAEPLGGWTWVTGEPWGNYQNFTQGEPNDQTGGENVLGYWPADKWNDYNENDQAILGFVVEYDGIGGLGMSYCTASNNSTGQPAEISATGSIVIATNDLQLFSNQLPLNQFGYYVMGQNQGFIPVGQGTLCLSLPFVRFGQNILNSGPNGEMPFQPDLTNLPQGTVFQSGATWNFQCWFRDVNPGNTSNLTQGLSLTFQ